MTRLLAILFIGAALFAQAPPITGVGYDALTSTSARIHWTAGFYHDATSDTTLTAGFTTTICSVPTITVGSTAGWTQYSTTLLIGGEWARVQGIIDGTHAQVAMDCTGGYGAADESEAFFSTVNGISISVASGVATVTTNYPIPDYWAVGHPLLLRYARTAGLNNENYRISNIIDRTHFQFTTSGVADGTYDYSTDSDIWLETGSGWVHSPGETISLLATDNVICYGDPGGSAGTYPHAFAWRIFPQASESSKHYSYITGQAPGSTIHYIVLSTPRQFGASSCSSPRTHTGLSADQAITFPSTEQITPTAPSGVTFSTALPGSYADSVTCDCSASCDLQATINSKRAVAGNHEIKIPAGVTCTLPDSILLPAQTNGSLVTVIRSAASDESLPTSGACLPPLTPNQASPCIDNPTYTTQLATLQSGHGSAFPPIFAALAFTPIKDLHIGPGLKLVANPHYGYHYGNSNFLIDLGHNQGSGVAGHSYHASNVVVDRVWLYQKNVSSGGAAGVYIKGGNSIAVVDSVFQGLIRRGNDLGNIQVESQDINDGGFIIKNNRILGGSMTIFLGDNGWNSADGVIQRNYLFVPPWYRLSTREYTTASQYPVASATVGATTTITTADETDLNMGYSPGNTVLSFAGATGSWAPLNVKEFQLLDGTLSNFNCASGNCVATTASGHGLSTGDWIWVGGVSNSPIGCHAEVGKHQITVTDPTHLQYASGTNAHCVYPAVFVQGPVFVPTPVSNTAVSIALNSTGLGALTGTVTMRYGAWVDFKNVWECKTCRRWDISGNILEGSFSLQQGGHGFTLTNRIGGSFQDVANLASQGTISDMNFHDNWVRSSVMFIDHMGIQDNGSSIPMNRISFKNNLVTDQNMVYCEPGYSGCYLNTIVFSNPTTNFVMDHNTALSPNGILYANSQTPPPMGNWTLTNSIGLFGGQAFVGGSDINNNTHTGSQIYQTSGTCTAGPCASPNPPFPNMFTWGRNALIGNQTDGGAAEDWGYQKQWYDGYSAGSLVNDYQTNYWPHGLAGVGFAGLIPITGASNTSPIVLTVSQMSCTPYPGDRVWVSGVRGNLGANGTWTIRSATSTSITLVASMGMGAYTSGGAVIPLTGKCNTSDNWALGSSSPYRAAVAHMSPSSDTVTTAGQGPALDGRDVGVDIAALNSAIGGGGGTQCSFSIDPTSVSFTAADGSTQINVIASAPDCAWSVDNAPDWMGFSPAGGIGSGQITATVSLNSGALRRASPIIAGQTFSVSQDSQPIDVEGSGVGSRVGLSPRIAVQ